MKDNEAADHCETLVETAKALGLAEFYPEALALGAEALRARAGKVDAKEAAAMRALFVPVNADPMEIHLDGGYSAQRIRQVNALVGDGSPRRAFLTSTPTRRIVALSAEVARLSKRDFSQLNFFYHLPGRPKDLEPIWGPAVILAESPPLSGEEYGLWVGLEQAEVVDLAERHIRGHAERHHVIDRCHALRFWDEANGRLR